MVMSFTNAAQPTCVPDAAAAHVGMVPDFVPGGAFTVGVEEELLLVDEHDELLDGTAAGPLIERVQARAPVAAGAVTTELFAAEIEFATSVCGGAEAAGSCLATLRHSLGQAGGRAMAAGLHPAAAFRDLEITRADRYEAIDADFAGLLRTPTAALQVHVGLPDAESAVTALRGLRHQLAVIRALAASTPYWHGQDSGLASARWAVISSYPRSGVPPVPTCWDDYVERATAVAVAAEAPDSSFVWWGARIQPRLGTVEVRVMDAQPSLSTAVGLTALVQGLARHAVEVPPAVDVSTEVLAENDFRVARHGLEATIADVDGTMRPVREIAARLVTDAVGALGNDGLADPLQEVTRILADESAYARQRRLHAEGGMAAVLADLTARTRQGW